MASFFGNLGKEIGNLGESWKKGGENIWDTLTNPLPVLVGDRTDAGILGQGQFKGDYYNIDKDAFFNKEGSANIDNQIQTILANRMNTDNNPAPVMDQAASNEWRARQVNLAKDLVNQMNGTAGPSIAEQQLAKTTDENQARAYGMAASSRGTNPSLAMRTAVNAATKAGQDANADAAILRANEQTAARDAYGQLLTNSRQQDLSAATSNLNAEIQSDANSDALIASLMDLRSNLLQNDRNAAIAHEKLRTDQSLGMNNINAGTYGDASKRRGDFWNNFAEGLGSGGLEQGISGLGGIFG